MALKVKFKEVWKVKFKFFGKTKIILMFLVAHQMPITNVDLHTGHGSVDFSPLCLSSSMDFGLKLWNFKVFPKI